MFLMTNHSKDDIVKVIDFTCPDCGAHMALNTFEVDEDSMYECPICASGYNNVHDFLNDIEGEDYEED